MIEFALDVLSGELHKIRTFNGVFIGVVEAIYTKDRDKGSKTGA
jgi:hypothetical protein